MDEECVHGGDPRSCPPCQRAAGRLDPLGDSEFEAFFFTARYEGQCGACDLPICVGQRVVKLTGGYVHAMCAP